MIGWGFCKGDQGISLFSNFLCLRFCWSQSDWNAPELKGPIIGNAMAVPHSTHIAIHWDTYFPEMASILSEVKLLELCWYWDLTFQFNFNLYFFCHKYNYVFIYLTGISYLFYVNCILNFTYFLNVLLIFSAFLYSSLYIVFEVSCKKSFSSWSWCLTHLFNVSSISL